jgi:hypothetical protein
MFKAFTSPTVVRHGASNYAHYIIVDFINAECIVSFKKGNVYSYKGVSRRGLAKLLMQPNISLGRWGNDYLHFTDRKVQCSVEPRLSCVAEDVPYMLAA